MEKKELKEEIKKVLEGKSIYEMFPISGLNPMTKEEIIYWIVETYIDQELDKAREEGRDEIINRIDKTKIPKRFWNKDINMKDYNKFSFKSFNNWIIGSNSYVYLNFYEKIIDLQGWYLESNVVYRNYNNQQEAIDIILALEDWSINCPYFKEGIKKYES